MPKQTPHTRTPRPKHCGHSVNSYVSCARLRLSAFHLPVPPHMSHATTPEPPHSKQSVSPSAAALSAAARCTPAKASVAAATETSPRREVVPEGPAASLSSRRGIATRFSVEEEGSAPGKVGRGVRRGTRSRSASRSRGENPCRASGRDEGRGRSVAPAPRARSLVRRSGDEPKRDADDRPGIAGDAPSSRGAAAATVRVERVRAPGLRPEPAQHAQMLSVAEDMVRRASRSVRR